ncbi:NUDIX hydrolase [Microbacterium profundi]|uniref:NUDIX hydrolase n=1 Tax=Microbacterium profundi TaxID=450380 RepID=UPI001F3CA3C8|nr:NUDIX hydrolase [Microbacterium profundi]MCE7483494.1 NUDIX hydrolase [Microbacterium profundi]
MTSRPLESFPRPSVAVDTAVLTVVDRHVAVLLLPELESLPVRLPGTFLHEGELLADAVLRSLRQKAGVRGLAPRQLHVFDAVDRDDRGRVLSVAFIDVVRSSLLRPDAMLVSVGDLPRLAFDHDRIVAFAVEELRREYRELPDPRGLLGDAFTLSELRGVHEVVLEAELLPDTFRRSMLPNLVATGELSREGRGRPAEVYRRG